ncbi:MAG: hypothetical protein EOP50_08360, partial [Sphingobacteriales bacterium]
MKKLLPVFSLLLSLNASAQSTRPSLTPSSSVSSSGRMTIAGNGQYLLFTSDEGAHIYDLKKRTTLATVPGIHELVLEAPPEGPYFYTLTKDKSTVQKRSLPLGEIVESIPIPGGFEIGIDLAPLIEPEAASGTYFTPVNAGRSYAVIRFDKNGQRQIVRGLPQGEKVNAICYRAGRIWALTSNGLWKQRDSLFERVQLPGEANYGNARFNGDTLVILGRSEISWFDTKNNRVARQTPIPGFFSDQNTQAGTTSKLRYHHSFSIDRSGKVWLIDGRTDFTRVALHYPKYRIALVGDSISYPFRSSERSVLPWKTMEE